MRGLFCLMAVVLCCATQVAAAEQEDSFAANRRQAQYYLRLHRVAEALPFLEKAAAVNPTDYDNGYDLALARLETKDLAGAKRLLQEMISRQDRSELHNVLGDVEEAGGNIDEAERQYEQAARMDPSEKNLFDLGTDLLRHQARQQALTVFEFAGTKYPKVARIQVGLGVALYSAGKYEAAVETLCRAVDLDPSDTKALDFLGGMYDVSPELADEVTKRLAHFVELYPDNAAANYYYALSLRRRNLSPRTDGSQQLVERLLKKSLRLRPDYAAAHYQLGLLYSDQHRVPEAVRELEQTTRLDPQLKAAHYRLSQLYAQEGKADLSRRQLDIFKSLKDR